MTGGMIRNIALNAAFCAAGRQTLVTTELILEMARAEFRKLQLPVSDADFRSARGGGPMKINLRIDQIVVDGPSLTRREREHLATDLEHELRASAAPVHRGRARRGAGIQASAGTGWIPASTARPHWDADCRTRCWRRCPPASSPGTVRPSRRRRPAPAPPGRTGGGPVSSFPGSPKLLRGGLVQLDPGTSAIVDVIVFQYNPDTVTRTLQPRGP